MTKTVSRRDSATAALRKLGVKPRDYDLFIKTIEINGTTTFDVNMDGAKKHLADLAATGTAPVEKKSEPNPFNGLGQRAADDVPPKKVTKAKSEKAPKAPKVEKVKAEKTSKRTCSAVAREMINAGKTNAEIWEVISKEFNLTDNKKYYPGWYRFEMKRKAAAKV